MISLPSWWLTLALVAPAARWAPPRWRAGVIALGSAALLATVAPLVVLGLGLWSAAFYALLGHPRHQRWAAPLFFVGLIGQLLLFKAAPPALLGLDALVVPLGLSFFTFKLLHYGIERARGTLAPHGLADLLAWVFLFPIFTAGPIERFDHHLGHRAPGPWREDLAQGLTRVAHGLIKKFVFADLVLRSLQPAQPPEVLLAQLSQMHPLQVQATLGLSFLWLYMDFSGYCDVAIGACRLMGVQVAENFNWPVVARNVSEFWQRWHISLSAWCQAYVYLPMIGLTRNPYLAALVTFVTMGLWHAVAWHWVAWGLWHALGVVANMRWQRLKRRRRWTWTERGPLRYAGVPLTLAWVSAAHAFTLLEGHGGVWAALRLLARCVGVDLP
ncbi:MAG: MBOAT family protein [Alphaproteobacteria bacterium]|nr:MBOAT family protein [Alphaproteobacteria bacterium]